MSNRFFEKFIIVGIDQISLEDARSEDRLMPKKLFMFPGFQGNSENENLEVVKDYCFPNGVQVKKIDMDILDYDGVDSEDDIIQDLLYKSQNWREHTHMFTIDMAESINCLCVTYNDLMLRESDKQLFVVEKAYCLVFTNNFYPCH